MFKLGKNKYFVGAFAILMAVGLMAAYIPMLFPQVPVGETGAFSGGVSGNVSGDVSGNISGTANLNQSALSGTDVQAATSAPATSAVTSTKTLPASLSGLQGDLNDLNSIQNSLNQAQ